MIVRPVARTGQTFVNGGTLRLPPCAAAQAIGSTIGSSQAVVNSGGGTLEVVHEPDAASPSNGARRDDHARTLNVITAGRRREYEFRRGRGCRNAGDTIVALGQQRQPGHVRIVTAIGGQATLTRAPRFINWRHDHADQAVYQVRWATVGHFLQGADIPG